jgi:hypothetical protein
MTYMVNHFFEPYKSFKFHIMKKIPNCFTNQGFLYGVDFTIIQ